MKKRLITILIVEDDIKILGRIRWRILELFNRQVQLLVAKTYKTAEEIIEEELADISIIDFGLPDGDGENLIASIRKKSRHHPIIVQTTITDLKYRVKIHDEYNPITYLTKDMLFEELSDRLKLAMTDLAFYEHHRLAVPGWQKVGSLDINEVCYVMPIQGTKHLHVECYDHEENAYKTTQINNMNLTQFIKAYNQTGYFIRCHNSYIVNRKMVKAVSRSDNEIHLLYGRNGYEVHIEMSEKYKKDVLAQLKGLY